VVVTDELKVLAIGHDGGRQGAPRILHDSLRWMLEHTSYSFSVVLHHDGPMRRDFERLVSTTVLNPYHGSSRTVARILRRLVPPERLDRMLARRWIRKFHPGDADVVWVNSVASWRAGQLVVPTAVPKVLHVHELEWAINRIGPQAGTLGSAATAFVAASQAVKDNLVRRHGIDPTRITVVYSSIQARSPVSLPTERRRSGRSGLGVAEEGLLLVGCGRASQRKGVDLLPEIMRILRIDRGLTTARLLWIGQVSSQLQAAVCSECDRLGVAGSVEFLGEVDDPLTWMALGDIFVLPSREEPLGLVCLEAALCGLPTVCFEAAEGAVEFVGNDAGRSVAPLEPAAMAHAVVELAASAELRSELAACGRSKINATFNLDRQTPVLAEILRRVGGHP
jgi:glycosyltransferase involved in cell wall biosynthesis